MEKSVKSVSWVKVAVVVALTAVYSIGVQWQKERSIKWEPIIVGEMEPVLESVSKPALPVASKSTVDYALVEQKAVAKHLSLKYKKPYDEVALVVKTAYTSAPSNGLSPLLVLAVIEQESGFRKDVVNSYGAMGLMQIVPRWHPEKIQRNNAELLDPRRNVVVGSLILGDYVKQKNGNVSSALTKYSGNANRYSERVLNFKTLLQKEARQAVAANTSNRFKKS